MIAPFFHAAIGLVTGIVVLSPRTSLSLTVAWYALAGTSLLYLFRDPKKRRAAWTGVSALRLGSACTRSSRNGKPRSSFCRRTCDRAG